MKTTYIVPSLSLIVGLTLTSIAAYYSILGLTVIFAGGMLGFIVMEIAKVTTTLWLHKHWNDSIKSLKYTLTCSVIVLMLITSMGTFGYLSKASLSKGEEVSVNSATVINLESQIQREQSYLNQNLKQIEVYSNTVSKLITDDPLKGSRERRNIQAEIKKLTDENKTHAEILNKLNDELLPFKTEVKKHEVEIGPLLYITKLIYGDEYQKYTEKTLSWLIIAIVLVFDPLAIMLLIASQQSFYVLRIDNDEYVEVTPKKSRQQKSPKLPKPEQEDPMESRRKKMQAKNMQM